MSEPRIIKRYTNRKLYDTKDSRYVTLSQIAAMVRAGEDLNVIDNATKEDLTSLTLAQIIYEQEKRQTEVLPLSALRELVRRSEARLADLREGRVGRLLSRAEGAEPVEGDVEAPESPAASQPVEEPKRDEQGEASAREKAEDPEKHKGIFESSRLTFEEWQRRVDERLKTLLDTLAPFRQLQDELRRVSQRIEELEIRIKKLAPKKKTESDGATKNVKEREVAAE